MDISQKLFVRNLILECLKKSDIELNYGDKAKDNLTQEMKIDIVDKMSSTKIPYMFGMNYCPKKVCRRIIERAMEHDPALNGGVRYQVKNPGSRRRKPIVVKEIDQNKLGEVCGLIIQKNKLFNKKRAAQNRVHYYDCLLRMISGKVYESDGKYYHQHRFNSKMIKIPKKWLGCKEELNKRIIQALELVTKARIGLAEDTRKTTLKMRQLLRGCHLTQIYWSGNIRGLQCKDRSLNTKASIAGYGPICYHQKEFQEIHDNYLAESVLLNT